MLLLLVILFSRLKVTMHQLTLTGGRNIDICPLKQLIEHSHQQQQQLTFTVVAVVLSLFSPPPPGTFWFKNLISTTNILSYNKPFTLLSCLISSSNKSPHLYHCTAKLCCQLNWHLALQNLFRFPVPLLHYDCCLAKFFYLVIANIS